MFCKTFIKFIHFGKITILLSGLKADGNAMNSFLFFHVQTKASIVCRLAQRLTNSDLGEYVEVRVGGVSLETVKEGESAENCLLSGPVVQLWIRYQSLETKVINCVSPPPSLPPSLPPPPPSQHTHEAPHTASFHLVSSLCHQIDNMLKNKLAVA